MLMPLWSSLMSYSISCGINTTFLPRVPIVTCLSRFHPDTVPGQPCNSFLGLLLLYSNNAVLTFTSTQCARTHTHTHRAKIPPCSMLLHVSLVVQIPSGRPFSPLFLWLALRHLPRLNSGLKQWLQLFDSPVQSKLLACHLECSSNSGNASCMH